MKTVNIDVCPIVGYRLGPVVTCSIVLFEPQYLTHPDQCIDEPEVGPLLALTVDQAREVSDKLNDAIARIDASNRCQRKF